MELNWTNVDRIIKDVLLNAEEAETWFEGVDMDDHDAVEARLKEHGTIIVQATMQKVAMVLDRLESHRDDVIGMLGHLEDSFFASKGGGMSLIKMPFTKDGEQWGEQWMADMLFAIAKGLGLAWFTVEDREFWASMPGGLPYITVKG